MSNTEEFRKQILEIIQARKESYGPVHVQSGIAKRNGTWQNVVTKVVPLHRTEKRDSLRKLDYGNFAIIEGLISIEGLVTFLKDLSKDNGTTLSLDGYEIQIPQGSFSDTHEYDSGDEYVNVGWFFKLF